MIQRSDGEGRELARPKGMIWGILAVIGGFASAGAIPWLLEAWVDLGWRRPVQVIPFYTIVAGAQSRAPLDLDCSQAPSGSRPMQDAAHLSRPRDEGCEQQFHSMLTGPVSGPSHAGL